MKSFFVSKTDKSKDIKSINNRLNLQGSHTSKKATVYDEMLHLGLDTPTKVCIHRSLGGIGDILMITPLLQAIKETFPKCILTFSIDTKGAGDLYYSLIKNNPYIDEVVSAHLINKTDYHIFKDITSVCLSYENVQKIPLNRIDIFAQACGFKLKKPKVFYKVEDNEKEWAHEFLIQHTHDLYKNNPLYIFLHTASFDKKRSWPIHKYLELIKLMSVHNHNIVYVINDFQSLYPYWNNHKNVINVSQFKIREMAALLNECDFFVGPDSGPMHIAGALNKPGLTLFGSIPPEARINHYPQLHSITVKNLACLGCYYKGCPFQIKCMTSLKAEDVYNKIKDINHEIL